MAVENARGAVVGKLPPAVGAVMVAVGAALMAAGENRFHLTIAFVAVLYGFTAFMPDYGCAKVAEKAKMTDED